MVSVTRRAGFDCQVIVVHHLHEYKKVVSAVKLLHPHVVGFQSAATQFHFVKQMAEEVKKVMAGVITVCGGAHPTSFPECALESKYLDAVFVGEAETAFVNFLECLESGAAWREVPNIAYVLNGKLVKNALLPLLEDLDELPPPDREVYPAVEMMSKANEATFLFTFGCPFLCAYCSNHVIARVYGKSSNSPRYRSVESCIREIEKVVSKFTVYRINFMDEIFGLNKNWRVEFCEKYRKRVWLPFECRSRADIFDEDYARMLKDAGCYRVKMGVESGNDFIRNKVLNRQMSRETLFKAFDVARKFGLKTFALNIIGVPGETEEMIWDTIRFNRELKPTRSYAHVYYPYRGTVLGNRCFEQGFVDEKACAEFSNERRDSVLRFPDEFKSRLRYYNKHWEDLVYAGDWVRCFINRIQGTQFMLKAGPLKDNLVRLALGRAYRERV